MATGIFAMVGIIALISFGPYFLNKFLNRNNDNWDDKEETKGAIDAFKYLTIIVLGMMGFWLFFSWLASQVPAPCSGTHPAPSGWWKEEHGRVIDVR